MKSPPRLDLGASCADRWTTCTASPHFLLEHHDKIPERDDTAYNVEGTLLHSMAHALLLDQPEPPPLEWSGGVMEVTGEMRVHAFNYVEYVLGLKKPGGRLLVEQKMPLWYMPERNCVVDAAVINDDALHCIDLKYGVGIVVPPEGNKQLVIYAQSIGTQEFPSFPPDDFPVFIHVYQPRGRAGETGPGHVWETTWGEVNWMAKEISDVASAIQDGMGGLSFAPSEKACQWCPFKEPKGDVFCQARRDYLLSDLEIIPADSLPLALPAAGVLTMEQRVALLNHGTAIKGWIDGANEDSLSQMRQGVKIPGFKLVMSRGGNRVWSDPQKAKALLLDTVLKREEIVEEKVAGPAAIEKLLGKKAFSPELTNLITRAPGVPVIAPESDKREAIANLSEEIPTISLEQ